MINSRTLATCALGVALSVHTVDGQGRAQYRDFQLGGDLASVAALAGVAPAEAKIIHQRPALVQELLWRPSHWLAGSTTPQTDPVQQIVFRFYSDQLFNVAIDYDHQRTEGMTDADMIDAISLAYGPPLKPAARGARGNASSIESDDKVVARWGDGDVAVVLSRSSYGSEFKMMVTSPRLDALARTAEIESRRLDTREAPQREIARQKKEVADTRASQEKARVANKATFRP